MALNDTALNAMANALRSAASYLSLHSADPGTTGTNETTAGRQPANWAAVANGDFALAAAVDFTGGAASGACKFVGLWSAATGGTFYGSFALTGDQAFNAAGEYNVDALTVNGTAS